MRFEGKDGVVNHFLMDVRARNRTQGTIDSYTQRLAVLVCLLLDLFQITDIEQVKVVHLRSCVQYLIDHGAGSTKGRRFVEGSMDVGTVRGYVRVWKAFFNWCYQEELIDTDVVARLRSPQSMKKVIAAFTVEHIEKMLATCDTSTDLGFRDYIILLLFLDTGMRLSELSGLNVESVNDNFVKVLGKGRREREIGIRPEISKLLWKYIHKYRRSSNASENALFLGYGKGSGKRLSIDGVKGVIRKIKVTAGIDGVRVSAHTFRHTFAKMYLKKGGELFKLSRELGHSSIKITETYLQDFDSSDAREDHNDFSPISLLNLAKKKKRKHNKAE